MKRRGIISSPFTSRGAVTLRLSIVMSVTTTSWVHEGPLGRAVFEQTQGLVFTSSLSGWVRLHCIPGLNLSCLPSPEVVLGSPDPTWFWHLEFCGKFVMSHDGPPLHETRSLGTRNGPVMLLDAFVANFFRKFIWVWSWEQRAWLQWFLCVEITNVKGGLTGHTVGSDSSWPQMTRCHQFDDHIKHETWTIQRNLDPHMDRGFLYLACGEVSSPRLRM